MGAFVGANLTRTYTSTQLANDGSAPGVGDVYIGKGGKRYRFVLHDNGAGNVAAVAGQAAYILASGGTSTGAYNTVTSDVSDSAGVVAGVWQAAPADGEYGWIQTWGICTLATSAALTSGADGDPLKASATDGALTVAPTTSSGTPAYAQAGVALDASARLIFLKCF